MSVKLAESLVAALEQGASVLSEVLANNPRSEIALTALADLSLLGSVLERYSGEAETGVLARSIRCIISILPVCDEVKMPGPEEWALHASRAWLEPVAERKRLDNRRSREIIDNSRQAVLALGPSWRPEEVAYVDACLTDSPLPSPRNVKVDMSANSMYEVAHIAFYSTDFGSIAAQGSIADQLGATAVLMLKQLSKTPRNQDVGIELILAARYLSGRWPSEANIWFGFLTEEWSSTARSSLRESPERFFSTYHTVAISALALIQFGLMIGGSDEHH